jgi:putative oxidoreductase
MPAVTSLLALRVRALAALAKIAFLPPLLARLTLGVAFAATGWGKVHHLDRVTGFFTELGIPMPGLNAVIVSVSELVCGTLLMVGVASRLATLPLAVSMVVALATAKAADIHGVVDLFGTVEFTYFALLVYVAIAGPGPIALDQLLSRRLRSGEPAAKPRAVAVA